MHAGMTSPSTLHSKLGQVTGRDWKILGIQKTLMIGIRFRGEIKLLLKLSTLATSTADSIAARMRFKLDSSRSRTTHRAFTAVKLNGIDGTDFARAIAVHIKSTAAIISSGK